MSRQSLRHTSARVLLVFFLAAVACIGLAASPMQDANADPRRHRPPPAARAVVEAVNALVPSDIGLDAAAITTCGLDRLPGSLAEILPLLPRAHRSLIEDCAHGRLRVKHREEAFSPLDLLDEPAEIDSEAVQRSAAEPVRDFFAGRPVDVATGAGLSEGAYPIAFDWVVALDPRTHTIFSFVLNCRD